MIKLIVSGNSQPEYIFYSNATHISYISVNGGESTTVLEANGASLGYDQLTYRLWYKSDITLWNSNLDASDVQSVSIPSTFGAFTIDAENSSIYYLDENDRSVNSIDYKGNAGPKISSLGNVDEFHDLQIDSINRLAKL